VYTWPDGAKYEGEFKKDDYNGQGTLTEADGRVYTGSWKNDQRHGHGVEV
jgi:hypothetical protein